MLSASLKSFGNLSALIAVNAFCRRSDTQVTRASTFSPSLLSAAILYEELVSEMQTSPKCFDTKLHEVLEAHENVRTATARLALTRNC